MADMHGQRLLYVLPLLYSMRRHVLYYCSRLYKRSLSLGNGTGGNKNAPTFLCRGRLFRMSLLLLELYCKTGNYVLWQI